MKRKEPQPTTPDLFGEATAAPLADMPHYAYRRDREFTLAVCVRELWLAQQLKRYGITVSGGGATRFEERLELCRAAIQHYRLSTTKCRQTLDAEQVTFAQAFEQVYGEAV